MTAPTAAPAGVHHLAIAVRDLIATASFYRDLLGLPVLRRWPAPEGGSTEGGSTEGGPAEGGSTEGGPTEGAAIDRSVWLDLGGGAFVALERTAAGVPARDDQIPGLQMLALRIAAATRGDWERRLAGAGVPVVHRTAYTIYVRDPEGNRIGLSHWPDAAPEDAATTGAAQGD